MCRLRWLPDEALNDRWRIARGQEAKVTMPQIVDIIDQIVYHGDYLYKPSEKTVLVVYGGLIKEASVIRGDPLETAKQLLRALVANRQTNTQL
jgi:hypothetical protein